VVDRLNEASVFTATLKSVFVVNRKIVNTALGRDVVDALSAYEVPVLKTVIAQRGAFDTGRGIWYRALANLSDLAPPTPFPP
jgi:chromosome partitioning protein